ncbi:MAG: hypothetical protein KatS3mg051_0622 [Anaerolineae bacterium]|nr:MAG: hypothetical protein KatS3mg051_0622 [Anaerolineae bacterium]
MGKTLRSRLLLSYVAVLLILLALVGFVLLAFLATRPLPTGDIISDLTAVLLDVRAAEGARLGVGGQQSGMGWRTRLNAYEQLLTDYLATLSAQRGVRALLIDGDGTVRYDSQGTLVAGSSVALVEQMPLVPTNRMRLNTLVQGRFRDPQGDEWLYVAQPLFPVMMEMSLDLPYLVVAAPVPRPTLREVFRVFGGTFLRPLAQAGLIALVIAAALSVLIAESVARPLRRMSVAARRIASGDYRQRVRVEGPREVQALARAFNDMAEQVAVTQQAQRDFLANVSHDLRTPLTSIQGFSQAIAEGVASDPAAARRAAQIIHDETARLHRMVESLLDLARLEAGQLELRRQSLALGDLLRGVGESLSVKARDHQLDLVLSIPPDLPRVLGDGDRLAQVFTNLLDNAIKHTPPGGTVTLSAAATRGGVTVTVRDTGEGIPPEDLSRIFERFYQVDKSRRRDAESGLGLGLAIARQIVEAHGGTIKASSTVGQGSTFTVWLPLKMTP